MYDASDLEYARERMFDAILSSDLNMARKWAEEVTIVQFEIDLQS